MAFTVVNDLIQPGDSVYYEAAFRVQIESSLTVLRLQGASRKAVPADLLYQFEGNFYGYLMSRGVPPEYHWIYLRVNRMHSPEEFGRNRNANALKNPTFYLVEPSLDAIGAILMLYLRMKE